MFFGDRENDKEPTNAINQQRDNDCVQREQWVYDCYFNWVTECKFYQYNRISLFIIHQRPIRESEKLEMQNYLLIP